MSTYAIGDIQGCYRELRQLLDKIQFDPAVDTLWLAGDLVNRGPDSLSVLRFLHDLGERAKVVLGNHDLHLLAVAAGMASSKRSDTLEAVLTAPDRDALLYWLQHQPLLHYDAELGYAMTHAGLPPQWTLAQAQERAREVEAALQDENHAWHFFKSMYGNEPDVWHNGLSGEARLRVITNYLTRMRLCDVEGRLELTHKQGLDTAPTGFFPWFKHPMPRWRGVRVVFGHWAALEGKIDVRNVYALDTGCVWGNHLSALRLEDRQWFKVASVRAK